MKKKRNTDQELLEKSYNQVAVNIYADHIKNNHKVYAICGCNQGVGATEIAVNLAKILANAGWKTVLINTNFRHAAELPVVIENGTGKGLGDFILGDDELESVIAKTSIENLHYIGCGTVSEKYVGEVLCSKKLSGITSQMIPKYDFVILDTYPILESPDAKIIGLEADGVILVAAINETTKDSLKKTKLMLEKSDIHVLGVVVTKVKEADISRRKNRRKGQK